MSHDKQFVFSQEFYIHVGNRALTQLYVMSYSKVIQNSVYFWHNKTLKKCHSWTVFGTRLYKEIVTKVGLYFQLQIVIFREYLSGFEKLHHFENGIPRPFK